MIIRCKLCEIRKVLNKKNVLCYECNEENRLVLEKWKKAFKYRMLLHKDRTVTGKCTWEEFKNTLIRLKFRDPYTGLPLDVNDFHIDHIIPVSKGGTNNPNNLVPCAAAINIDKFDKDVFEWWKEQDFWNEERAAVIKEIMNNKVITTRKKWGEPFQERINGKVVWSRKITTEEGKESTISLVESEKMIVDEALTDGIVAIFVHSEVNNGETKACAIAKWGKKEIYKEARGAAKDKTKVAIIALKKLEKELLYEENLIKKDEKIEVVVETNANGEDFKTYATKESEIIAIRYFNNLKVNYYFIENFANSIRRFYEDWENFKIRGRKK